MKKSTKRLIIFFTSLACLLGIIVILYVAFFRPPPRVMDVERLIPPDPDTLIITRDMAVLWESMGEHAAVCDIRFLSLLGSLAADLGPIQGDVTDHFSLADISPELLFYLLGYESALAVYPPDDDPGFLFVSRVHPAVVFLEQFVIFIDEETHINRVPSRGFIVREVSTEKNGEPTLFYTFDDDILVFSSDRELFDAALDLLTGAETRSIADETIRRALDRFRSENASAWGFSRGGLVKNDTAATVLLRIPDRDGPAEPFPLFFSMTCEGNSLRLTAARDTGGDSPRRPPTPPQSRDTDRLLLSFSVNGDLIEAGKRTSDLPSRLFPSGCRAVLLSGDSSRSTHPVIWGTAGPDADSIMSDALEDSDTSTSRSPAGESDIFIISGASHDNGIAYALIDDLLIIGRDEADILAHRRFIQDNAVDPSPPPGVIIDAHLRPTDLAEASDFADEFLSMLSGCGILKTDERGGETELYRELIKGLSAWETADAVMWTDDGQTNLNITLSWKEEEL